jgi:pilus assembly protein CpaD
MITSNMHHKAARRTISLAAMGAALLLSGCANGVEPGGHVAGWTMISPDQRHPIIVSEQPATHSVRVGRGSDGLSPHQRAGIADFISRYRGADGGNGSLSIAVPSGSANEISALKAVADAREIARDMGIDDSRVAVSPYRTNGDRDSAIRISYTRYVAEGPECGMWPTNVGDDARNMPHPNLGCATQRNFAMQVANPADLLGPRTMTPAAGERRDARWEKFNKGETTVAKKDQDERASTKSEN